MVPSVEVELQGQNLTIQAIPMPSDHTFEKIIAVKGLDDKNIILNHTELTLDHIEEIHEHTLQQK
jgi:DNA polymerase/3'-5' exonuclease PolX